ncbi:hypothetical protein CHM34_12835 [Paludifilum halophilum]|uniref:Uncharacterized protein n=1 Tax=Paludifilum halophilum TaxID=1642702 RepID=A0A235B4V1_9BACL|nr:hypothetical protein CHM34_12835 [Paludifilum halophilum]
MNKLYNKLKISLYVSGIFIVFYLIMYSLNNKEPSLNIFLKLSVIFICTYGTMISLIADYMTKKVFFRIKWLLSLLIHVLGGIVFPFVLKLVMTPEETFDPIGPFDYFFMIYGGTWALIYSIVNTIVQHKRDTH